MIGRSSGESYIGGFQPNDGVANANRRKQGGNDGREAAASSGSVGGDDAQSEAVWRTAAGQAANKPERHR